MSVTIEWKEGWVIGMVVSGDKKSKLDRYRERNIYIEKLR